MGVVSSTGGRDQERDLPASIAQLRATGRWGLVPTNFFGRYLASEVFLP